MGPRPQRLPLLEAHVRAVLGASGRRHRRRIHLGRRRAFLRRLHRGLQRHPVELPFPVRDGSRPDGKHAAALGSQNNSRFQIAVDGKVWDDAFDMAWPVVFSPAGDRAAAKVRRDGKFALYVDGNAVIENLDGVWNPTFSPDGTVLLFCSLKDGVFSPHTVRL